MKNKIKLDPYQHKISFNDKGCKSVDLCFALCCKGWDINLAFEEYQQSIYKAEKYCIEDKGVCSKKKKPCPQLAYRLKKSKNGSCIYLDKDNRCKIYTQRPIVCRNFGCDNGFKLEPISIPVDALPLGEDIEICSFEGGLSLKTKFIFNPFLRLKKVSRTKGGVALTFQDIRSCKQRIANLIGQGFCLNKKATEHFLSKFNGQNALSFIKQSELKDLSKESFLHLVSCLINEEVLVGVFC